MRGGGRTIWTQTAVNMVRVEELVLWAVEQPREPAAIHSRHTDDEELLGEERVKVMGGDDVKVDGELGVRPGAELGRVQVRVTWILGTGAEAGDNCNAHSECLCHYENILSLTLRVAASLKERVWPLAGPGEGVIGEAGVTRLPQVGDQGTRVRHVRHVQLVTGGHGVGCGGGMGQPEEALHCHCLS